VRVTVSNGIAWTSVRSLCTMRVTFTTTAPPSPTVTVTSSVAERVTPKASRAWLRVTASAKCCDCSVPSTWMMTSEATASGRLRASRAARLRDDATTEPARPAACRSASTSAAESRVVQMVWGWPSITTSTGCAMRTTTTESSERGVVSPGASSSCSESWIPSALSRPSTDPAQVETVVTLPSTSSSTVLWAADATAPPPTRTGTRAAAAAMRTRRRGLLEEVVAGVWSCAVFAAVSADSAMGSALVSARNSRELVTMSFVRRSRARTGPLVRPGPIRLSRAGSALCGSADVMKRNRIVILASSGLPWV